MRGMSVLRTCPILLLGGAVTLSLVRSQETPLPLFGRDTVLVWKTRNPEEGGTFVVRVAEFLPNRFIEWEDTATQGTVYLSSRAVENARGFLSSRLFVAGVDTSSKDATCLWLSRRLFQQLKTGGRVKLSLDSIDGWMRVEATDFTSVEVNRAPRTVPVLKVKDDRGNERWFIDSPDNPLLVRHGVRNYEQVLVSITTDRSNTLRWIKGKKLSSPRR